MRVSTKIQGGFSALLLGGSLQLGCAGSSGDTNTPAASSEPQAAPQKAEDSEQVSDEEAALLEQIEESAAAADAESGAAADEKEREVVYRVSPEGMKITVSGTEFIPRAEAVKVRGGWGVRLTVSATASEKRVLFSPSRGPMAFGGIVTRRGESDKFGDKREGGAEVELDPNDPVSFSRTWPGPDQQPLQPGDEVELHVMLWGFGADSETRRPVAKFLMVKMAADKQGATPLIQPPGQ